MRFWNEQKGEISTVFVKSLMFGHARGDTVSNAILETLSETDYELPIQQLIALGSDGPNVNKTIWKNIDDHKKALGFAGLTPFVPCTLHVVHNSFRKGLNAYGEDAEQLSVDLFQWFKSHISQREDYAFTLEELGLDEELFIRHVQCRWLMLLPALERILRHWEAVCQYFLKDLPQRSKEDHTHPQLKKNTRYIRICQVLSGKECKAQIQFLVGVGPLFEPFLRQFQKQEPLIHLLYSETSALLKSIMLRFIKFDVVGEKSGRQLTMIDAHERQNLMDIESMEIGADTQKTLSNIDKGRQKTQRIEMLQFYQAVTSYLQTRLPLNDMLVRSVQCLHPEVRDQERAQKLIREVCTALPTIDDGDISRVTDEWKLYRAEDIKEDQIYREGNLVRLDHFWNYVLSLKNANGELKYPYLRKVVLTCLCIPHGNADVERSLSVNKKLVTAERSLLSEESVNGLRLTRDAVSMYKTFTDVPVTKELLTSVKQAHKRYTERVEAEKSEAQLLDRKRLNSRKWRRKLLKNRKTRNESSMIKKGQLSKMS